MRNEVNAMLVEVKGSEFRGPDAVLRKNAYESVSKPLRDSDDLVVALGTVLNRKFVDFANKNNNPTARKMYAQMILTNAHKEFNDDISALHLQAVAHVANQKKRVQFCREVNDTAWQHIMYKMLGHAKPPV